MPIYEYRCSSCGAQKDVMQKMSEAPLTTCPECGKETFGQTTQCGGLSAQGQRLLRHRLQEQACPVRAFGLRELPVCRLPFVKKYLLTGLLVWVPLGITLWVLNLIISTLDRTLGLLPYGLAAGPTARRAYSRPGRHPDRSQPCWAPDCWCATSSASVC